MSIPHPGRHTRRIVTALNILLAGMVPTACISTDPTGDRREAVSTALDRLDRGDDTVTRRVTDAADFWDRVTQ